MYLEIILPDIIKAGFKHIVMHIYKTNSRVKKCDHRVFQRHKGKERQWREFLAYLRSLCFGLGREYFRYPSQGTFFRPARADIMPLTLHKCIKSDLNELVVKRYTAHLSLIFLRKKVGKKRPLANSQHSLFAAQKKVITSQQTQWESLQVSDFGAPSTTHHKQQPRMSSAAADALWRIACKWDI